MAGKRLALFQINPLDPMFLMSHKENEELLLRSMVHLATGHFFMESFHRCAECHQVDFPGMFPLEQCISTNQSSLLAMRFNAIGTFIGMVNPDKIQPKPDGLTDHRSLQYPVFLASPFLTGAFHKYSGSEQTGHNGLNGLGAAVDAFAHHVVVDSGKTVLLCDLQGIFQVIMLLLFLTQIHRHSNR